MPIWLLLHLLGFTMWIGGGLAAMAMSIAAKREERATLGAVARIQALLHRTVIGPGAMLAVLSGLVLTFRLSSAYYTGANGWLILMQGTGVLAALVTLFISIPTVSRLARISPEGETARYFDELRNRHKLAGSISGTLALAALIAGAMLRA